MSHGRYLIVLLDLENPDMARVIFWPEGGFPPPPPPPPPDPETIQIEGSSEGLSEDSSGAIERLLVQIEASSVGASSDFGQTVGAPSVANLEGNSAGPSSDVGIITVNERILQLIGGSSLGPSVDSATINARLRRLLVGSSLGPSLDTAAANTSSPPPPGSNTFFTNEPAGFVARIDDGLDYPGVAINDPWFSIIDSNLGGRINHGGVPSIQRNNDNQPHSPPSAYRAFYPAGFPGGHDAARLSVPIGASIPGQFFLAFTVRLPEAWHTLANDLGNGIKHVIPWVNPADGSPPRPLGWTGFAQEGGAGSGTNRYVAGYTLENIPPETFRRRNIPYVNLAAATFNKQTWVKFELYVRFNSPATANNGLIELFINDVLVAREVNAPVPVSSLHLFTVAGTYGGGIGDVPHDMWYDIGHLYLSHPA